MDDIIKEVVSQKLRKRGAEYNLNENSQLASEDFIYASKISSKIYQYAKRNWPAMVGRPTFNRLVQKIEELVRRDEEHALGQLRIGYGNSATLKDFRWNKKKAFSSLVPWQTQITYNKRKNEVSVKILKNKLWEYPPYNSRISSLSVQYHALKVPCELKDEIAFQYSKELNVVSGKELPAGKTVFPAVGWDNCLIIVTGVVRCRLWENNGKSDFLTSNLSFMGADILEVFRIRDGKLMKDTVHIPEPKQEPIQEEGTDWV